MPWDEEQLRRAMKAAADDVRPAPDALARLRARSRRRTWVRTGGLAFAGAAAAAAIAIVVVASRPEPVRPDVEFALQPAAREPTSSAAPVVSERADGGSILAKISPDGRFVVFMSEASTLVPGDTNGVADTFVRDLSTGAIERVSVSSTGAQGDAASLSATISRGGRFVAFRSRASNLVPGDTNGAADIFVRDRVSKTTTRVSIATDGTEGDRDSDSAVISADGRFVAFRSLATTFDPRDRNRRGDIFVHDVTSGTTALVSVSTEGRVANGDSRDPQISADGHRIAFASEATNLVAGDTNRAWDVFVRDVPAGFTLRASVSNDGEQATSHSVFPSISGDGNTVAFVSAAPNLVTGDTNHARDIFVRDLGAQTLSRVSVAADGKQANGSSLSAALSADGRFVAFSSDATNLIAADVNEHRDVFVVDRSTGTVTLASVASDGRRGDADSGGPAISADGRFTTFQSFSATLSAGDRNGVRDVFVFDLGNRTTSRVSG